MQNNSNATFLNILRCNSPLLTLLLSGIQQHSSQEIICIYNLQGCEKIKMGFGALQELQEKSEDGKSAE